jgi:predicted exporter
MGWSSDEVSDRLDRLSDVLGSMELTVAVVLIVTTATFGVLAFMDVPITLSIALGVVAGVLAAGLLWLDARRRGRTSPFDLD